MANKKVKKQKQKRNKKTGNKKRNNKAIFLLIVAAIFCLFAALLIFLPFIRPLAQYELDMYLRVGNYTGIDVNASALHFGTVLRSATVSRKVTVTNTEKEKFRAKITILGDLADWTKLSENSFLLFANESKSIEVSITVPPDAEKREYMGKLRISFYKTAR